MKEYGRLLCGLLLLCLPAPLAADAASEAQAVIVGADLTYSTSFTWRCSPATWERLLDHPLLMAALWKAYGFAPAYAVSARGDTLHVDDPTGLVGDALPYRRDPEEHSYLVLGKVDHWAVPFFNEGSAVFILTSRPSANTVTGLLKVYVQAGSAVGSLVLKAGKPVLARHVDNRITLNLEDARNIVEAVDASPRKVVGKLDGPTAEQFENLFLP